jgi:hypothetical protein
MPEIALRQETTGILLIFSSVSSCYSIGTREFELINDVWSMGMAAAAGHAENAAKFRANSLPRQLRMRILRTDHPLRTRIIGKVGPIYDFS